MTSNQKLQGTFTDLYAPVDAIAVIAQVSLLCDLGTVDAVSRALKMLLGYTARNTAPIDTFAINRFAAARAFIDKVERNKEPKVHDRWIIDEPGKGHYEKVDRHAESLSVRAPTTNELFWEAAYRLVTWLTAEANDKPYHCLASQAASTAQAARFTLPGYEDPVELYRALPFELRET